MKIYAHTAEAEAGEESSRRSSKEEVKLAATALAGGSRGRERVS